MGSLHLTVKDYHGFRLVRFDTKGTNVTPEEFAEAARGVAGQLAGDVPTLLNGPGPIWGYGMLVDLARSSRVVAIYYPQQRGYLVVGSQDPHFAIGRVIPDPGTLDTEPPTLEGGASGDARESGSLSGRGWVVAVGGPPDSGKSVFLYELYSRLRAVMPPDSVFLRRANPDGDGMFTMETDPQVADRLRREYRITPGFLTAILEEIEGLRRGFQLLLLDLGGRTSPENAEILVRCTHLIVLTRDEAAGAEWQAFGEAQGCSTLAVLDSQLVKQADGALDPTALSSIDCSTAPARGTLVNLDRAAGSAPYGETVGRLAEWLLEQVRSATGAALPTTSGPSREDRDDPAREQQEQMDR